jgi:hypothetical protein
MRWANHRSPCEKFHKVACRGSDCASIPSGMILGGKNEALNCSTQRRFLLFTSSSCLKDFTSTACAGALFNSPRGEASLVSVSSGLLQGLLR